MEKITGSHFMETARDMSEQGKGYSFIAKELFELAKKMTNQALQSLPTPKGMTIEECKDEVAKDAGYKNGWAELIEVVIGSRIFHQNLRNYCDRVTELYASQKSPNVAEGKLSEAIELLRAWDSGEAIQGLPEKTELFLESLNSSKQVEARFPETVDEVKEYERTGLLPKKDERKWSDGDIIKAVKLYETSDSSIEDIIRSLAPSKQEGEIGMWCELECSNLDVVSFGFAKSEYKIKLINGQPIIHFKK